MDGTNIKPQSETTPPPIEPNVPLSASDIQSTSKIFMPNPNAIPQSSVLQNLSDHTAVKESGSILDVLKGLTILFKNYVSSIHIGSGEKKPVPLLSNAEWQTLSKAGLGKYYLRGQFELLDPEKNLSINAADNFVEVFSKDYEKLGPSLSNIKALITALTEGNETGEIVSNLSELNNLHLVKLALPGDQNLNNRRATILEASSLKLKSNQHFKALLKFEDAVDLLYTYISAKKHLQGQIQTNKQFLTKNVSEALYSPVQELKEGGVSYKLLDEVIPQNHFSETKVAGVRNFTYFGLFEFIKKEIAASAPGIYKLLSNEKFFNDPEETQQSITAAKNAEEFETFRSNFLDLIYKEGELIKKKEDMMNFLFTLQSHYSNAPYFFKYMKPDSIKTKEYKEVIDRLRFIMELDISVDQLSELLVNTSATIDKDLHIRFFSLIYHFKDPGKIRFEEYKEIKDAIVSKLVVIDKDDENAKKRKKDTIAVFNLIFIKFEEINSNLKS